MTLTPFDTQDAPARPLWLMTLADLGLLLLGFFVFVQASQHLDPAALSASIREGFGIEAVATTPEPDAPPVIEPAMAQELGSVAAFASGSAEITQDTAALALWVRGATADPRTRVRLSAGTDGTSGDVDPVTRSAALLAADRARAVAVALVEAGAIAPDRIEFAGGEDAPKGRRVLIAIGFAGDASLPVQRRMQ
jgi:flagellar motor protein MotB